MTNKVVGMQYVVVNIAPMTPTVSTPQVSHAATKGSHAGENSRKFGSFV